MELMARYPDKHFDLAIVDPPYGCMDKWVSGGDTKRRQYINSKKHTDWDKMPSEYYFSELFRVSKNQIIWGGNYFSKILEPTNNWIIWYKNNDLPLEGFSMAEMAWTSIKKNAKVFEYRVVGNLGIRIHPTQKPVKLYEWLLTNYAKPNDLILDTHCGSASSLIACENLGFKYIASELDKDYYSQSLQRLEAHLAQGKLFQRVGRDEIRLEQPSMFA